MLSPVKAITAGALVFALGGVMLIAQPFGQQGSVPGAETDTEAEAPAWVTGTLTLGTIESSEGALQQLIFVVRGPHRRHVTFGPVHCVPELLDVTLGEKNETETSVTVPVTKTVLGGNVSSMETLVASDGPSLVTTMV